MTMSDELSYIEKLAVLMQSLGYKAKIQQTSIFTGVGGYGVLVIPKLQNSIQLYLGFTLGGAINFTVESANKFNAAIRFVKCYVDDGALSFEQDFLFDPDDDEAETRLSEIFEIWEGISSLAKSAIDAEMAGDAGSEVPD